MNAKHTWIPVSLAIALPLGGSWLAASLSNDGQARNRLGPQTRAEGGIFGADGWIGGVGASASGDEDFGSCADVTYSIVGCEAPVAEPASPTPPVPIVHESLCGVAPDGRGMTTFRDAKAVQTVDAAIAVPRTSDATASTFNNWCGKTDLSTNPAVDLNSIATSQVGVCSCGLKQCGCG